MSDPGPESQGWLVGVVANDGALAGLRVHAGWIARGPASGRSVRVHLRLRFVEASGTGLPGIDTAATLLAAENVLTEAVGDLGEFVAAVTAPGFRDLVWYTADLEGLLAQVEQVDRAQVGYDVEVDYDDDAEWAHYRAMFSEAVTADGDRRRIVELARNRGAEPPEMLLAHRFLFPTLAEADQAAAALRTAGVLVTFVPADDVDAEPPPAIDAHETETISQAEIARSRDALSAFAVSWEGTYEGWLVVPEATEASDAAASE